MSTRVALVNPPNRITGEYFPIGLGIIAAVLKNEGHDVFIIDDGIECSTTERLVERVVKTNPDIIGITGLVTYYGYIKHLSGKLNDRIPNVPIMVGGPITSAVGDLLLEKTRADIVVIGEGERTVVQICEKVHDNDLSSVCGIWYRDKSSGVIVKNPPQDRISDLDTVPMPQYDMFAMDKYVHTHSSIIRSFNPTASMNVISSRGCPYQCTFCSKAFGRKVSYRSVVSILDEVRYLKKEYGVDFFLFNDELFTILDERITEFCERLLEQSMDIHWAAWARPQRLRGKTLELMKRSGCRFLSLGVESGSQRNLDDVKKKTNVEEIIDTVFAIENSGIRVHANYMIGYPNDDLESIRDTLRLRISINNTSLPYYTFLTPLPGTVLFDSIKAKNGLDTMDKQEQYIEKFANTNLHFGDVLAINITNWDDTTLLKHAETIKKDQDAFFQLMETQGVFGERLLLKILEVINECSLKRKSLRTDSLKTALGKVNEIIGYFKENYGLALKAYKDHIEPRDDLAFEQLNTEYGVLGENANVSLLSTIDSAPEFREMVEALSKRIPELARLVSQYEIRVASAREYV
ncbi:MAG: B12-binding domain-containing radical SAM protein [Deltaproteobacteria bacterium]|nr:B12-binding domain-containing radical SAM protein [Deltaproteobacteria bacterium]